ncbi:MAG: NADH:flavin oxidoreductase/NADH oxidase [Fimbriimonadales bacterium]|nr:NADH:flavin oxidoreductase/NADH oxidase [Fimbriimonadales bacterium]
MPSLFDPITIRSVTARNRAWMSPMCQYSAVDGVPNEWHLVHLGSRAIGGAGMIVVEATAIEPEGRITPGCTGIWNDEQADAWSKIVMFIQRYGAIPAIQLAHAGRKASTHVPWSPTRGGIPISEGGWTPKGVTSEKFVDSHNAPHELTVNEISAIVQLWASAAQRASDAGFQVVEIHAAHGYLLHQFYSPISNTRNDQYGGSFANRTKFLLEVCKEVRVALPESTPLLVRLSATDWVEGGWTIDDSIELSRLLKQAGVDLIDCSSGGAVPNAQVPISPGYQVEFAHRIRRHAQIPTAAVGRISEPKQANAIIDSGQADAVMIGRAMLDDPYWAVHAARELGIGDIRTKEYAWVQM